MGGGWWRAVESNENTTVNATRITTVIMIFNTLPLCIIHTGHIPKSLSQSIENISIIQHTESCVAK